MDKINHNAELLFNENIKLVSFVIGKYFQNETMMEKEDMFQYGCIGLYNFCEDWINKKYENKKYQFSTMAIFHIRSKISHALDHQYRKYIVDYDSIKRVYEYDNRDKKRIYNIRFYINNLIDNNILNSQEAEFVNYKMDGYKMKDIKKMMNISDYYVKSIMESLNKKMNKEDVYDILYN